MQAYHVNLLGATAECFFIGKHHQWNQNNILATFKMLKEKNQERFVTPDANILALPNQTANFKPTDRHYNATNTLCLI